MVRAADVRPERYTARVNPQDADPARTPISRGTKSSNPLPSSGESRANPKKHVGDDVGKWHTSSELQRAEHGCSAQSPTPMRCARKRGNFPKSSSNLN